MANEKRLIYAEDLLKPVNYSVLLLQSGGRNSGKTMAMYEKFFRKRVEMAPTVDAAPVVHGRWIPVDGEGKPCDEWDCSICERRLTFGEEMEADEVYELNHYCPNCGAKMDGGSHGQADQ